MDIRKQFFGLLSKYWWVLALIIVGGLFFTNAPIFKYLAFIIAVPFLIMIFLPFFMQIFAPAFFLVSSLSSHFKEAQNISIGKKYVFIPMSLIAAVLFVIAQTILSIWIFIMSFLIWSDVIGSFFSILLIFFFGLAPLAIISAPFVIWIKGGFALFLGTVIFFLVTLFWYGLSKLAFSENYSSTPETFLGYSPQTFLLGALSCQVVALPFYNFKMIQRGGIFSYIGGLAFLFLTIISAIKWQLIKKKLSREDRQYLYKPSIWVYILGFIVTDIIYASYSMYHANTFVLMWLNVFFAIAIIYRVFCSIGNMISRKQGASV